MDVRKRIAGVVVLYHPPVDARENIRSYAPYLGKLIGMENSPTETPELRSLFSGMPGGEYVVSGRNLGMAAALNQAAELAIRDGFEWLLTMDQDSRFLEGDFLKYAAGIDEHKAVGMLTPRHFLGGSELKLSDGWEKISTAMTSGNLLNLSAYRQAGPFHEPLFLDYVDHEYCFRLAGKGLPIYRCNGVALQHSLGELREEMLLGIRFRPTNHSPLRRYYMTRNRLYLMSRYPSAIIPDLYAWAKELAKLILFEDGKREKLGSMGKGVLDFVRRSYGPSALTKDQER